MIGAGGGEDWVTDIRRGRTGKCEHAGVANRGLDSDAEQVDKVAGIEDIGGKIKLRVLIAYYVFRPGSLLHIAKALGELAVGFAASDGESVARPGHGELSALGVADGGDTAGGGEDLSVKERAEEKERES